MARAAASPPPLQFTGQEHIVVLHGKETFLHTEGLARLKQALAQRHRQLDVLRFDGGSATLADVLDEVRSLGLMAQYKLVVVDNAEPLVKTYRQALERYAEQPQPTATLLLRSETWYSGNLDKKIAAVGKVIKCDPLSERSAGPWLTRHCQEKYGCKISARAASLLLERVGLDMGRLDSELAKLAAFVRPGQPIDEKTADLLGSRAGDEQAWHIKQALLSGDPAQALVKLRQMLDLADLAPEQVAWHLADLLQSLCAAAHAAAAGQSLPAFCRVHRIWGDLQKPFIQAVGRLGTTGSAALLAALVQAIQNGRSQLGDARSQLERFCLRFALAVR